MSNTIGPNETTEEPIMSAEIRTIIETLSVMSTSNHLLTFTDFLTINLPYLAWYLTFLPTLSFLRTFFLITIFAIPFELVFAL